MALIANIVVSVVALLHVYFLVLEMFLWDRPTGLRTFGQTLEAAKASKVLAANQGLYNGFLAAGLVWGLILGPGGANVKMFFLGCVLIAASMARQPRAGRFSLFRRFLLPSALRSCSCPEGEYDPDLSLNPDASQAALSRRPLGAG